MEFFTLAVLILNAPDVTKHLASKASDTLGDFLYADGRDRRIKSPISAMSDIGD